MSNTGVPFLSMNRRDALKLAISAFVAQLATGAAAQPLTNKRVIVIGAGIAGLAAAQRLKAQGAEVIVLEAGAYVGGRIRTDHTLGAPFERGAGWIHGPSRKNPIRKLADQVRARTVVTDDDNLEVFDASGQPLSDKDYRRLDQMYEGLEKKLTRAAAKSGNRSLQDVIKSVAPDVLNDPMGRWVTSAYTEFDLGAGLGDISARNAFADEAFGGADVVFTQGYDLILAPLVQGLDIRLRSKVSKVKYGANGVQVNGLNADYVVCSVPLGVLKAKAIAFDPPLPAPMASAIREIGFGTVTKIALKFDTPFWDTDVQYFGIMTEPRGRWNYWLNYRTFSNENILLGLSVGDYAPVADRMSQSAMTKDALRVLRSVWGADVGKPRTVLRTRWSRDPNFRGAYSYPQAGGSIAQFRSFEAPVEQRLFMAGEHTNFDYHSTTHGALVSGQRAADAIRDAAR